MIRNRLRELVASPNEDFTAHFEEGVKQQVTEGAAVLDAVIPHWFTLVNPETLRMDSPGA